MVSPKFLRPWSSIAQQGATEAALKAISTHDEVASDLKRIIFPQFLRDVIMIFSLCLSEWSFKPEDMGFGDKYG